MKTTTSTVNSKIQQKSAKRKCRSHLNQKLSYEPFSYDPLNVFSKSKGTFNTVIMYNISKGFKIMGKNF